MKFKLVKKANPQHREEVKWYANAVNAGNKDLKAIADLISHGSSLTSGDIQSVLQNLVDMMPMLLQDGFSLHFGDFGTFRLSLSSEGSVTMETFNAHTIKGKVVYTPGVDIKHKLEFTHYEHAHQDDEPVPPPPPAP